ncbi:PLC-like phosphodiesterase [Echria macrotheca]|uniref:PLC-like phosphodiesterase n=1 Tax=Echria macrotheca TaxID=438768 RepID=A0AAJ0BFU6_9PEZI|nr:PLC-like phosphodiesterase [Echria macrotheca]
MCWVIMNTYSAGSPSTALVVPVATSAATGTTTAGSTGGGGVACNNSPVLCSRTYNNITHMGAHDSAFLRDASTGNSVAGNQFFNATVALSAGIRLLQAQVHLQNNTLRLCHTSCTLLDAGPLFEWLAKIKVWMDANPNEVVTLLLVNSDSAPADQFGAAFDASGLSGYGFVPPSGGAGAGPGPAAGAMIQWPTLQNMIASSKRVVSFLAPLPSPSSAHPFLLDEFTHVFETPFDVRSLSAFTCTLDRPKSKAPSGPRSALQGGMLSLVNHFAQTVITGDITVPNVGDIATTNSPSTTIQGALGMHVAGCAGEWGGSGKPNFVLVDFWDKGPAVDTADRLNGIVPTGRKSVGTASGAAQSGGQRMKMGDFYEVFMDVSFYVRELGWYIS